MNKNGITDVGSDERRVEEKLDSIKETVKGLVDQGAQKADAIKSKVVEAKVERLVAGARAEMDRVQAMGGAVAAVESGYMKQALVSSHSARRARIENGEDIVVGVNCYETTEPSPLTADLDTAIQAADPEAERAAVKSLEKWRDGRDGARCLGRRARRQGEGTAAGRIWTT